MKKIKSNKGATGIDIAIALGIVAVTLTILLTLYTNTYISNSEIERRTQAMNYASQILEKVSEYYYSDVNTDNFSATTNSNGKIEIAGIEIPKAYTVNVNIENYSNSDETDVVKKVEVNVTYKIGKKDNTLTLSKFKTKETLITPNAPKLQNNMVAVKAQNNGNAKTYKDTSKEDTDWYNYLKKKWALARISNDLYVWIPRYAYYVDANQQINIEFLYSNKNQKVDTYGNLENIPNNYNVDAKFSGENENGYWVKVADVGSDETATRLNNSKYGAFEY